MNILPNNEFAHAAVKILDDDRLDREWVVRNVLGGMSAGFGLRGMNYALVLNRITY